MINLLEWGTIGVLGRSPTGFLVTRIPVGPRLIPFSFYICATFPPGIGSYRRTAFPVIPFYESAYFVRGIRS